MMPWTRLDLMLVSLAVLLTVLTLGYRGYQHLYYERAADHITSNIYELADTVNIYHTNMDRWFPLKAPGEDSVRIFPDPFHTDAPEYQGLDSALLQRENNYGMVLQLAEYSVSPDAEMPIHLFEAPYLDGEPYLRVLLGYGDQGQVETEILMRVQERLPDHAIAERDDHYYVIDLRALLHVE